MKRLAAALLVTVVLLGLLAAFLDLSAETAYDGVAEAASHLSPSLVALAFALYAASYVGRGLRLAVLLPGHTPIGRLVSISARHNLFNLVLPLRSGEASLPLMLRAEVGRSLAEGTAALLVARVLDLSSVAVWFLVGLSLTQGAGDPALASTVRLLLGALLLGLVLLRPVSTWVARRLEGSESRLGSFAGRATAHLAEQPAGRLALAGGLSLATWLLTYGACFTLLADMGAVEGAVGPSLAAVDFSQSLVGTTLLHLTGILPINTLAGVGPWEAGWTAGYVLVGVDEAAALASAVVSHAAILLFVSLLGGAGWLLRGRGQPMENGADPA